MAERMIQTSPKFVIVDRLKEPLANLKGIAAALHKQANYQLGSWRPQGWGIDASVRAFTPRAKKPQPGEIQIVLLDEPDMADALGYHDVDEVGTPLVKVFPRLDSPDGVNASVTISHEICEVLVDPDLSTCYQSYEDGRIWAGEVCDAVQADSYEIDGVRVSNFVLPSYFSPPRNRAGVRYDWMGLVKEPFEIRPGGYGQILTRSGWVSLGAQTKSTAAATGRAAMRCAQERGDYQRARTNVPVLEAPDQGEVIGPPTGRSR